MKLMVKQDGENVPVTIERHGSGYAVTFREKTFLCDMVEANAFFRSVRFDDGRQFLLGHHTEGQRHAISFGDYTVEVEVFDPLTLNRKRREDEEGGTGIVRALMPGRVVKLFVEEGAVVTKGTGLLILEAMKMENEITAPADGTVVKVFVASGETVDGGADLLLIE